MLSHEQCSSIVDCAYNNLLPLGLERLTFISLQGVCMNVHSSTISTQRIYQLSVNRDAL